MAGHVPTTDQTRSAGVPKRDISCLVWNTLNEEHYVQWEGHYAISTCILIMIHRPKACHRTNKSAGL
jgi:hypothetical protein